MPAPIWKAGTSYAPGAIVQPASRQAAGVVALVNPNFDTPDLTGWEVTREGGAGGTFSVASDRPFSGAYAAKWLGADGTGYAGGTATIWMNTARALIVPGQEVTVSAYIAQDDTNVSQNYGRVRLYWFNSAGAQLSFVEGNLIAGNFNDYRLSSVTSSAPAEAAYARLGVWLSANTSGGMRFDNATWSYTPPPGVQGLVFKAVQAATGKSGAQEPAWPNRNGLRVTDNEVTWEAISSSRIVWQAAPILLSGATEPVWPSDPGGSVADGTIVWQAFSGVITDPKCPQSKVVAITASKVFAGDKDIVRFSATANPLDWTTPADAGYLPTGLQQSNANDIAVLNLYRSNIVAMNASCFQMWQADPNPELMAIMDQMEGIGSSWQSAAQPVGNDLFYLSQQGVRSVSIAGASTNLQAGDVGMPIDPLVQPGLVAMKAASRRPLATYYPGAGQYWLAISPSIGS